MELTAIILAALSLGVALLARGTAKRVERRIEDGGGDARRRIDNGLEEVERALGIQRRMLARIAAGDAPSREQILEGILWGEVDDREGVSWVAAGEVRLLDVRSPQETAAGIIPGAIRIPVDEFEARQRELPRDDRRTLVYCAGGSRSAAACEFLSQVGHDGLFNLTGGISGWTGPTEVPKAGS